MSDAILDQAEAALKRGDAAAAESALTRQWRDMSSAPADAQHVMAMVRMAQQNRKEAAQHMRGAVRAEPNKLRHHIGLGHILYADRDYAGAMESYAAAVRIDPTWPGLQLALSSAAYNAGRPEEAEQAARQAVNGEPSADAHDALSCALRAQGKGQEALAAAEQALRLDPRSQNALNSKGAALLLLNRGQEALAIFDALVMQGADTPVLALNRGMALESVGRKDDAKKVYDDAARRWPNLPNLQERIKARQQQ